MLDNMVCSTFQHLIDILVYHLVDKHFFEEILSPNYSFGHPYLQSTLTAYTSSEWSFGAKKIELWHSEFPIEVRLVILCKSLS